MEKLIKRYVDEKGKEWGTYKIECPKNLEKNLLYKMEDYTGSIV